MIPSLTEDQRDAIQEVANVAIGQAGDALARQLDSFVILPIPNVKSHFEHTAVADINELLANKQFSILEQRFRFAGAVGHLLVVLHDGNLEQLVSQLGTRVSVSPDMTVHQQSLAVLDTLGPVLGNSCLQGFTEQLGLNLELGDYRQLSDSDNEKCFIQELGEQEHYSLSVENFYQLENQQFQCDLLLLFGSSATELIFQEIDELLAD